VEPVELPHTIITYIIAVFRTTAVPLLWLLKHTFFYLTKKQLWLKQLTITKNNAIIIAKQ